MLNPPVAGRVGVVVLDVDFQGDRAMVGDVLQVAALVKFVS